MKRTFSRKGIRAFTLIEALALIAVLLLLAAFLLPAIAKQRARSSLNCCINNLRQINRAFRIWEGDNGDRYPMQVSTSEGGSMEWIGGPNAWRHFEVMSNELNTPKILVCPCDRAGSRTVAAYFGKSGISGQVPFTNNLNLSYFVGADAVETNTNMFLAGDRSITKDTPVKYGMLTLTTNAPAGWTDQMHGQQGNIAFADGSVRVLNTSALRDAIRNTGVATNRLAMP
jgi:prepilin-type processing-associated H-X9-DG protein